MVITRAVDEVEKEGDSILIKSSCPNQYQEWVILNTVIFLLVFFNPDKTKSIIVKDDEGNDKSIQLNSINNTGVSSTIKRDAIDANITRDYYEPSLPEGYDFSDFPYGKIKGRVLDIMNMCRKLGGAYSLRGSNNCVNRCKSRSTTPHRRYGRLLRHG
jgi:hypothetical protein